MCTQNANMQTPNGCDDGNARLNKNQLPGIDVWGRAVTHVSNGGTQGLDEIRIFGKVEGNGKLRISIFSLLTLNKKNEKCVRLYCVHFARILSEREYIITYMYY